MTWHETFNRSRFSHFINSPRGRIFRVAAGAAFLIVGFVFRYHPLGADKSPRQQLCVGLDGIVRLPAARRSGF